jgi:hypothetical protein
MIRAIFGRIAGAPPDGRAAALAQLLILSKLRKAKGLVEKEHRAMGFTISVEDIPLLREPIDRAMREGEARGEARGMALGLELILRQRFGKAVPANLIGYLSGLQPEVLAELFKRVGPANTLEEVLADHMAALSS